MVKLAEFSDYVVFYGIAALFGIFGGLIGELLKGEKGRFKASHWVKNKAKSKILFADFGGWASLLVGGAAAMAVWWLLPPKETAVPGQDPTYSYSVFALVSLSIVVGSAGSAFLAAFQAKALATVQEVKVKAEATSRARKSLEEVAATAESGASKEDVRKKAEEEKKKWQDFRDSGIGDPDEEDL
ncbi:hypothetical protein JNUCC0626_23355 [Lentzea sp. JNUCC 0626]|uniref:hypothetical protein n=1 Tax=Lentzea sp. JNUCC 0626 TaxID=3367513 RepID=UPI003748454C